jgi:renalase
MWPDCDLDCSEVVVIGAGVSGLICARDLQTRGFKVLVLDKSKGVGGRLATRRLHNTCVDHGIPYLIKGKDSDEELNLIIDDLSKKNIIEPWKGEIYELKSDNYLEISDPVKRYFAKEGITSVAKYLVKNEEMNQELTIKKEAKVVKISKNADDYYLISLENSEEKIRAKYVVFAIPAPQILILIENSPDLNLSQQLIDQLASVTYYPRFVVMAGYSGEYELPKWQGIRLNNEDLRFILLDSSKRNNHQKESVFVFHSTPEFANDYFDNENLDLPAKKLLNIGSQLLDSWLNKPNWYSLQRWRYATVKEGLNKGHLQENNLFFCGDWCYDQGSSLGNAIASGFHTSGHVINHHRRLMTKK